MTSHQAPAPAATPVIVNPSHLHDPTPHGYSTAVIAPAAGRLAFISGQGAYDRNGALSPDFPTQVEQAYANLAAVIAALGARPDQVVKLTVYVVGHDMSKLGILTEDRHAYVREQAAGTDAGSGAETRDRPHALRGRGCRPPGLSAARAKNGWPAEYLRRPAGPPDQPSPSSARACVTEGSVRIWARNLPSASGSSTPLLGATVSTQNR